MIIIVHCYLVSKKPAYTVTAEMTQVADSVNNSNRTNWVVACPHCNTRIQQNSVSENLWLLLVHACFGNDGWWTKFRSQAVLTE
jgi:hypothetical protein